MGTERCRAPTGKIIHRARILTIAAFAAAAAPAVAQTKAPEVGLTLNASVSAIGPGTPFETALRFDIPEGFHIYWENPGDSGMAPTVHWKLPDGFTAGPLRFPMPKKHESVGMVTNILEGTPILLTTITPPQDLSPGGNVQIEADVRWLVCKEACFQQHRTLRIRVPAADATKPLAEKDAIVFKIAQRQMPTPADKAKYATVRSSVTNSKVAKGDTFDVVLNVGIKPGYHVNSDKPLSEYSIPTEVYIKSVEGIEFDAPQWPEARVHFDKQLNQEVSNFYGDIQVKIPARVVSPTASADVSIAGLFKYQACEDHGRCFPAEAVEWSVSSTSTSVLEKKVGAAVAGETVHADAGAGSGEAAAGAEQPEDRAARKAEELSATGGLTGALVQYGLLGWIVLGFLGGLILNVMPCVLPVISIKVLSFMQQAHDEPRRVFQLGLTFAAGIIVSFWILAGAIIGLQAITGVSRGWGALFQRPEFVIAMIAVVFAFALSLFGVFEVNLSGRTSAALSDATEHEGFTGAFMKGILATLLATPCTAPFLAPAITLALASSVSTVLIVFTAVGAGMASPYILLTARPSWMKFLPKPGNWMVAFKQFMGFILVGTVVWLLFVLGRLLDADAVVWTIAFLTFLALACWLYGRVEFTWSSGRKLATVAAALLIALGGGAFSNYMYDPHAAATEYDACNLDWSNGVPWIAYKQGIAEELAREGHTVYLDYTAIWCVTCQANKKLVFSSQQVLDRMKHMGVVPIKADFTAFRPDIQEDLDRFNRDAVPLNIIFPAERPGDPIVLPIVLTANTVLTELDEAGPSTSCPSLLANAK